MFSFLQRFLGGIGGFVYSKFYLVLVLVLLFTVVSFVGIGDLRFESDFSKFDPDVPIVGLNDRIGSLFPSFSSFLVVVSLDDSVDSDIVDIRDPRVMQFLVDLNDALLREQKVQSVSSAGILFSSGVPDSLVGVKDQLSFVPGSDGFFNARFSMTPVFVSVDVSGDSVKIEELNERVLEVVSSVSSPGGISVSVTGEPPLFSRIFGLMIDDAIFTIILSAIVIFVMLLFIQRSFVDAVVIILPVLFGVSWTIGMMGLLGIPITIATAAIGAMLLGLGVEYSIFLNARFVECSSLGLRDGLVAALSSTGASTVSSGFTTMMGFFALGLSMFPMLSDLGVSLGLGIAFILSSVMVVGPLSIISRDRLFGSAKVSSRESRVYVLFDRFGSFVARRSVLVLVLSLVATVVVFQGSSLIVNENVDFDTILPSDLPELQAFNLLSEEFEDTTTIRVFVELDASIIGSDEPFDIRDPRVVRYVDVLSQKFMFLDFVERVDSLSVVVRGANGGVIPGSLSEQKELLRDAHISSLVTDDYSGTLIKVVFADAVSGDRDAVVSSMEEIIFTTASPSGVSVVLAGGLVAERELDLLVGPDSSFTAMVAFAAIIVFLFVLSRSFKYTFLPLLTVVVAIVWIMGLIGFFGIPWNNIISSVISMTIGIGIDFGIQLSNRYRLELESFDKRTAMRRTLKYVLYPMIITVIAALIGFLSMGFGQLQLMGDLGRTMSVSMVASMVVAVTLVASLMVLFERDKSPKSLKDKGGTRVHGKK